MPNRAKISFAVLPIACFATPALASSHVPPLDGSQLQVWWVLPFVCLLMSIAVLPLILPLLWHRHYGKIAVFWGLAFLAPFAVIHGAGQALYELQHTILLEYLPFIILLFALYTISGGVRVAGDLHTGPGVNTGILAAGTLLANVMGTTGASMLLIRPLLRANRHRRHKVHTIIFFIFLVSNIGGLLTPLGDPPLFLGFLQGVSFFWTMTNLAHVMLLNAGLLLAVYFILDTRMLANEAHKPKVTERREPVRIEGTLNLALLAGVVCAVLLSGFWRPGISLPIGQVSVGLQDATRDLLLLALSGISWFATSRRTRQENEFTWEPILEVAKLFLGIFISMIPAIAILKAGRSGALGSVISLVTSDGVPVNQMYFWLTGILSSFLDNAPTYLVFFNTAGGDANLLMEQMPITLAAISCGAVFMGANSYIGNAPNFMVRSIAESHGVDMPSFFGYMLWAFGILVPLFALDTFLFFLG